MQIKFVLLVVFQVVILNEAYNFSCPPQAHWELRAKSMCIPPRNYTCLYNVTFRVNVYRDRCSKPRILASGYKYVFQPNLNRAVCCFTRYQPFIFDTIGRSDCTFLKSFCSSEGQMTFQNGNTTSDRTCICNINKGYTFVTKTNNPCSCNPSNEDCSCYNNRTIGSKDLKCFSEITLTPSPSRRDTLNKSSILKINDFDNYKYNIILPKEKYRTTAAFYVLILVLAYLFVTVCLYILQRHLRRLISTPQNFEIVECSDRSITVQWNINNQDDCLDYALDHRPKGLANWKSLTLLATDITIKNNVFRVYKLQDLLPETYYELRICFMDRHGKGQYTESKTKQTLKSAPQNLEIVECTDISITVQWSIKNQDGCLNYVLDHRPKGLADWKSLSLLTTDISAKNNGFRVHKLQDLLPETYYELRICVMDRHGKGQYTESKIKQTLKSAPQNLEIVECTDISITVQWSIKNQNGCLNYVLDHRPKGLADWKSLSLSTTDTSAKYNGCLEYELQDLLPETYYELRICVMHSHVKDQYTESKTQQTLKAAPTNFGIFDCTDRSITVQWSIQDQDGCLPYVLDYRSIWLADWKSLSFSTTDISAKEYGFRVYELQNLLPETSYELRLCFMLSHAKGQYTESKTQQTLKAVLPEAIKRLPEGDIIRYNNLMQSSKTEKRYFIRIMILGKKSAGKTCLLRKLLNESIEDVSSTDGIDIAVRRCKINIENRKSTIDKDIDDKKADRIRRAVIPTERAINGSTEGNHSKEQYEKKSNVSDDKSIYDLYDPQLNVSPGVSVRKKETEHCEIVYSREANSYPNLSNFESYISIGEGSYPSRPVLESYTRMETKINVDVKDERNTDHHEKLSTYINETIPDTNETVKENTKKNESSSLVMPSDLLSHVFSKSTTNTSANLYALCELWDFAGEKDFYATNQAFFYQRCYLYCSCRHD